MASQYVSTTQAYSSPIASGSRELTIPHQLFAQHHASLSNRSDEPPIPTLSYSASCITAQDRTFNPWISSRSLAIYHDSCRARKNDVVGYPARYPAPFLFLEACLGSSSPSGCVFHCCVQTKLDFLYSNFPLPSIQDSCYHSHCSPLPLHSPYILSENAPLPPPRRPPSHPSHPGNHNKPDQLLPRHLYLYHHLLLPEPTPTIRHPPPLPLNHHRSLRPRRSSPLLSPRPPLLRNHWRTELVLRNEPELCVRWWRGCGVLPDGRFL